MRIELFIAFLLLNILRSSGEQVFLSQTDQSLASNELLETSWWCMSDFCEAVTPYYGSWERQSSCDYGSYLSEIEVLVDESVDPKLRHINGYSLTCSGKTIRAISVNLVLGYKSYIGKCPDGHYVKDIKVKTNTGNKNIPLTGLKIRCAKSGYDSPGDEITIYDGPGSRYDWSNNWFYYDGYLTCGAQRCATNGITTMIALKYCKTEKTK